MRTQRQHVEVLQRQARSLDAAQGGGSGTGDAQTTRSNPLPALEEARTN